MVMMITVYVIILRSDMSIDGINGLVIVERGRNVLQSPSLPMMKSDPFHRRTSRRRRHNSSPSWSSSSSSSLCMKLDQDENEKHSFQDLSRRHESERIDNSNIDNIDDKDQTTNNNKPQIDTRRSVVDLSSQGNMSLDRREMLMSMTAAAAFLLPTLAFAGTTAANDTPKSLEDIQFGNGSWKSSDEINNDKDNNPLDNTTDGGSSLSLSPQEDLSSSKFIPASFVTYLTRFLINYDEGVSSWWTQQRQSYQLLSPYEQQTKVGKDFGNLSASLQATIQQYLLPSTETGSTGTAAATLTIQRRYERLFETFANTYYNSDNNGNPGLTSNESQDEIGRQLCLLAATLPPNIQPKGSIKRLLMQLQQQQQQQKQSSQRDASADLSTDLSRLLPTDVYSCTLQATSDGSSSSSYKIQPPISLYQVGVGEEFGQAATATAFGPLAATVLTREMPKYPFNIYMLFGVSGATGCALTHSLVIPLDVVKTKAQTNPDDKEYSNLIVGAQRILDEDGVSGLLTGAQATLAGYFWYGLSVYPSYAFFKRWLKSTVLPIDVAVAHANDIALVAGALAAVIASIGLTPLEAARIRVVADPDRYRPLGLVGTLKVIAEEGQTQQHDGDAAGELKESLQSLYAGLPSLMTRQVIFGSVKFLAFERACEAIYAVSPSLRDATWTSLIVSLLAGGFSGALSSFVSQPADAVLTYVAAAQETVAASESSSIVSANGRTGSAATLTVDTNQSGGGGGGGGKGMGVLEGCRRMIDESGPSSLFRGLGSRSLWAASIIAGQFLLYDVFRTFFG
eukprot:CAMPEP_0113507490 /NCGR_PEP_ID=MMETSP0014_2-20120614/36492_1 /TAXON_ID=2857 /ORGANISM="Nitzschia sp." /LENGTH=793 /DNA_ID=CAMNT_0000403101 /DNA_START=123 /DNA_END=2500 /DNA_ORIENTATION=+ /assembly_acc=CAM_ASM_000159